MVARQSQRDTLLHAELSAIQHLWHGTGCADGEDGGLRRIDDGTEFLDAIHAEIGDGERATLIFVRGEATALCLCCQRFAGGAQVAQAQPLALLDDRSDQTFGQGDGESEVDRVVLNYLLPVVPRTVDLRVL